MWLTCLEVDIFTVVYHLQSYIKWYYSINLIMTDTTVMKSGIESHVTVQGSFKAHSFNLIEK
jgi:hypothetical protein